MKKKIKDLTEHQMEVICVQSGDCFNCPLCVHYSDFNEDICIKDFLEKEVEVDD